MGVVPTADLIVRDGNIEDRTTRWKPKVAISGTYLRIGCHKISREVFELLIEKTRGKWGSDDEQVVQNGGLSL